MPIIKIPEALLKFTGGKSELVLEISSLSQLPASLLQAAPLLHEIIFIRGTARPCGFVNFYLDGQLISDKLNTPIPVLDHSQIDLVAALSGG